MHNLYRYMNKSLTVNISHEAGHFTLSKLSTLLNSPKTTSIIAPNQNQQNQPKIEFKLLIINGFN